MKITLVFLSFSLFAFCKVFSQDSTFYKNVYAGGYLIVNDNEVWELESVFINDGSGYNVKISNNDFNNKYNGGDTIKAPYYSAEMELLERDAMIEFQIYFKRKTQY